MHSLLFPLDTPKSVFKVIVYYWPNANLGVGHITCSVQEVGGKERKIFITPSFLQDLARRDKQVEGLPRLIEERRIKDVEKYFPLEFQVFNSQNVIKIELPISEVSMDVFVEQFVESANANLTDDYSFFARNYAYLASQVLSVAYPSSYSAKKTKTKFGSLPSVVASDGCLLLGEDAVKRFSLLSNVGITRDYTAEEKFTIGDVIIITKYQFATEITKWILNELDGGYDTLLDGQQKSVLKNFKDILIKEYPIDDDHITEAFKDLNGYLKGIEKKLLEQYYKVPERRTFISQAIDMLKILKCYLYEFIRIFSQDPKLESLQNFKNVVGKIEDLLLSNEDKVVEEQRDLCMFPA